MISLPQIEPEEEPKRKWELAGPRVRVEKEGATHLDISNSSWSVEFLISCWASE